MIMRLPLLLIIITTTFKISAQQTITFPSEDKLLITADHYFNKKDLPYILLFHQANSSRGEYRETAGKLMKLGFNCLAVDLRSGKEVNYVQNETAARAAEQKLPTSYLDAEKDILASISYVKQISQKKVILFGSSYSASLVMKVGNQNPDVEAIVAFSPGEYFQPKVVLKDFLADFDKPVYINSTSTEKPFVSELISDIPSDLLTFFASEKGEGVHGSKALWEKQPQSDEVWLSLLLFFKKITAE
jgi:pimeloyl-ACP methyl ester carboxylesterase